MAHGHRQTMDVGGLRGDQLKFGLREGGSQVVRAKSGHPGHGSQISQQDEASVDTTSLPLTSLKDNLAPGGAWARPKSPADKLHYLSLPGACTAHGARRHLAPAFGPAHNQGGWSQRPRPCVAFDLALSPG